MIVELGHFALYIALFFSLYAVLSSVLEVRGSTLPRVGLLPLGQASILLSGLLAFSFIALCYAFVANDFTVLYVAHNSHSELSWVYRVCAVWGAHEGSMLLWTLLLSLWTLAFSLRSSGVSPTCNTTLRATALPVVLPSKVRTTILGVLCALQSGFIFFILATSSPFLRDFPFPAKEGADLNPLLQDPGFIIHPPMLYNGYVGLSIPFAIAVAALLHPTFRSWARLALSWSLGALGFMVAGITLGSWWAYYELGWGGWWFWDPVENASLMPALIAIALSHCLMMTSRDEHRHPQWTLFLALLGFSLSLLGTFLVRSGIVSSVHSFASSPSRGLFILGFFTLVSLGGFGLLALRGNKRAEILETLEMEPVDAITTSVASKPSTMQISIYYASVFLVIAMLTVLLGTLYPLIIETFTSHSLSVGAPYFNTVVLPLLAPTVALCGVGLSGCVYSQHFLPFPLKRFRWLFSIFAVFLVLALGWLAVFYGLSSSFPETTRGIGSLGVGYVLAALLMLSLIPYVHQRWSLGMMRWLPGAIAHFGIAVFIVGISFSSVLSTEHEATLSVGETLIVGEYQFHFVSLERFDNPHDEGVTARIDVVGPWTQTSLYPQKRYFKTRELVMTETALRPAWINDLYVALGSALSPTTWSMRLYLKPFIRWIWVGGALMALGSGLGMVRSRRKKL